jgi:hypothetical protein
MQRSDELLKHIFAGFLYVLAILLAVLSGFAIPIFIPLVFIDPHIVLERWDIYLGLFVIPWTVSAIAWRYSKVLRASDR